MWKKLQLKLKLQLKEEKEKKREYIKHSYMNLSKEEKGKKRIWPNSSQKTKMKINFCLI